MGVRLEEVDALPLGRVAARHGSRLRITADRLMMPPLAGLIKVKVLAAAAISPLGQI